jgi:hypothetical protein
MLRMTDHLWRCNDRAGSMAWRGGIYPRPQTWRCDDRASSMTLGGQTGLIFTRLCFESVKELTYRQSGNVTLPCLKAPEPALGPKSSEFRATLVAWCIFKAGRFPQSTHPSFTSRQWLVPSKLPVSFASPHDSLITVNRKINGGSPHKEYGSKNISKDPLRWRQETSPI